MLEAAGTAANLPFIGEKLAGFAKHLAELIANIRAAVEAYDRFSAKPDSAASPSASSAAGSPLLTELASALESGNASGIDSILEELGKTPLDSKTREGIGKISDRVLMADFDGALEIIAEIRKNVS